MTHERHLAPAKGREFRIARSVYFDRDQIPAMETLAAIHRLSFSALLRLWIDEKLAQAQQEAP